MTGQLKDIKVRHHNFNKVGTITGKILGGNLSVLCSLVGSQSFVNFEGEEIKHKDAQYLQPLAVNG